MDKRKVLQAVNKMGYSSIKDYLKENRIKVYTSTDNFDNEDAYLCNDIIFIRKNLPRKYRNFVLLHEIGHHIMHSNQGISFSFSLRVRKNKLELEADTFACLMLLQDEELEDVDVITLLQSKGVPEQIAIKFYESRII